MTSNPFQERRTRSQVKLPDVILKVPEQSPLKNARNAARKHPESSSHVESTDYNENELQSSSDKHIKPPGSKRSVPPLSTDEYRTGIEGMRHEREPKRMKWDPVSEQIQNVKVPILNPIHARTNSEPNAGPGRKSPYKQAGTTLLSNKPHSTSNIRLGPAIGTPTDKPGKARAHSVPLFPSSSSLPQLDLRNPPMSPIRARSRSHSPDKHHGLKVHPSPPKLPLLELPESLDRTQESKMLRETDHGRKGSPAIDVDTVMERADELEATVPEVLIEPPKSSATPVSATVPYSQPPVTPVPSGFSLSAPMSPLTPLPETPLSLRTDVDADRYTVKSGWSLEPENDTLAQTFNETGLSVQTMLRPEFERVKDTSSTSKLSAIPSLRQIPRPSIVPPTQLSIKVGVDKGHFRQRPLKPATPKSSSTLPPNTTNAFALLMKNSTKQGANKPQDKGKGKSESLMSRAASSSNGTDDAKKTERGKAELEAKKSSLKDRMRRKEKKTPDAPSKFVPVVFSDDENLEVEAKPEHQNTISPIVMAGAESHTQVMEEAQSGVPTSSTLERSQIAPSSKVHEPLQHLTTNNEDGLLQTQVSSPISSTALLSESNPGGNRMVSEGVTTPLALAMIVNHPIPDGEGQARIISAARSPAAFEKFSAPKLSPVIDHLAEQQACGVLQQLDKPVPPSQSQAGAQSDQGTSTVAPKIVPNKRGQSNIPTSTRVTRSALKPPVPPPQKQMRRKRAHTVDSITRRKAISAERSAAETGSQGHPPGSPMQTSSPSRVSSRNLRTPGSSPAKISLTKAFSKPDFSFSPEGSPSPAKIAKAISMLSRPMDMFAVDDIGLKLKSSSLSTLSEALDKLKTPAPSRPNTSLGFNPDTGRDDEHDTVIAQQPLEATKRDSSSRDDHSVKHSFTPNHGAGSSRTPISNPSSARTYLSTGKPRLVQKPMTMFFSRPGSSSSNVTPSHNPHSAKNMLLGSSKPPVMGASIRRKGKGLTGGGRVFPMMNKRLVQKASKKTSLPTVEASPVKGGESRGLGSVGREDSLSADESLTMVEGEGLSKDGATFGEIGDIFLVPMEKGDDGVQVAETSSAEKWSGKGKEKDKLRSRDSSRRASMALSQLSQSLSAGPAYGTGVKESMGPPSTPRKISRSVSSSYPASSSTPAETSTASATITSTTTSTRSSTSPDKAPGSGGTRFSVRQAAKAASQTEIKSPLASVEYSGPGKKTSGEKEKTAAKKSESLSILKDCRIFVDVRTDDGEEAGSLFVEMLESLGAKMQARVGQACTHVIFKNGVMSTISRYRLLRDPKPFVIGIAWVVECVEQRQRVEETPFLIDLNEMNIAGTNKRRRSMLPKLIGSFVPSSATDVEAEEVGDADVSMDGSTSSLTLDDDLTPLERARRRRSTAFGAPV